MKTKAEVIYMPDLSTKYRPRTKTTPRKASLPNEAKTVDRKVRFGAWFEAVVPAGFPSPAADYEGSLTACVAVKKLVRCSM